jgi:dienelactone hydrolase
VTRRGRLIASLGLAVVIGGIAITPAVRTAALMLDLAGRSDGLRDWLPVASARVHHSDVSVPTRYGAIAARIYTPDSPGPTVALFPGIHGGGVDEPRFARFSSRLASTGVRVVAVPLPDLREFRVTSRSTDMLEDATAWAARDTAAVPGGRVGLVGVSFAGGLALVAAGRPSLAGRLSAVVSIGGHGDLGRTLRYLATGRLPDGTAHAPHDYGLAVAALAAAPILLPPATRQTFVDGVRTYLEASLDASPDFARGRTLVAQAKAVAERLPPVERAILLAVIDRDVATAGAWVEPAIDQLTGDPGLSPERSRAPSAPVFLLHGLDDNVIPSAETPLVANYLLSHGTPDVHWLLTPYLTHADVVGNYGLNETWRFFRFWHALRQTIVD